MNEKRTINNICKVSCRGTKSCSIIIPMKVCQELGIRPGTLMSLALTDDRKTILLDVCGQTEVVAPTHRKKIEMDVPVLAQSKPAPQTQSFFQRILSRTNI